MIGILGGMGTQAGLDFCNKLAIQYRGKIDQDYPLFFYTTNQIFLEDQSLLEKLQELFLIDTKILHLKKIRKSLKKFNRWM